MNTEIVKNLDLFKNADQDILETIGGLLKVRSYSKGSNVFLEDEKAFGICFLIKGSVKLMKSDSFGKELILKIVSEGSVFGEVVLFNGGNYPATAFALQDSQIAILYNEELEDQVRVNPQLALNLIKILSIRLRKAQEKIKELALMDTKRRLYNLLIRWANEGRESGEQVVIENNLTQQEIADLIGTTRETVTRTIKELKDSKILKLEKGKILILNLDRLKTYALI